MLKDSSMPDISSKLLVSQKSLMLNYSDCVKHCESESMILPNVNDNKRIQEEFQYIFDGSGTLAGLALNRR